MGELNKKKGFFFCRLLLRKNWTDAVVGYYWEKIELMQLGEHLR
jgi:hypothetical protein